MPRHKPVVLVVDRESEATRALIEFLRARDLEVAWSRDGEGARGVLERTRVDCMVAELRTHRIDGLALLERARALHPELCAVLIATGHDVERAVEAMRRGAYDFQVKPVHHEKLLAVLERGLSHQKLAARVAEIEGQLDERFGIERLHGRSRAILRVMEQVQHTASTRATVLIEGEPGTGKGIVAQAIHQLSPRRSERFVWIQLGALVADVMESELFGQERDASSGAAEPRPGRIEVADLGTLYLDDIGEAPPAVQVRLLRFLQDRAFERVGGTQSRKTDVRLIAGTHRDLSAEVKRGRFRDDLYQRLSVVRIQMPALRERIEDVPLLVESFIREFNREHNRRVTGITRGALESLLRYPWPGNVRELKNAIEGMVVFAEGKRPLDLTDLPDALREAEAEGERLELTVGMTVEGAERNLIAATLRHTGNDKTRAAAMLGIGLRTLYRKIKRFGIH
jgi:DNA-binding NtrC family response regulator